MNSVSFTGNAGRDAETRFLDSGKSVASFTVAIYEGKDRPPTWVNVTAWDKTAEIATDRVRKGVRVGVEGRLKEERWTDKNSGEERSRLTVTANRVEVMEASGEAPAPQRSAAPQRQAARPEARIPSRFDDADIPF
jgi:single-strand DNA-binding protein